MPNGLHNWTFNDVAKLLKENGFVFNYTNGSHYYYIGSKGGKLRQVTVPFHGNKSINPRTLKSIIVQSGMTKEEWVG